MNGGNRYAFGEMPNTGKSSLDIQARLRVDLREPIFGSKCGKP